MKGADIMSEEKKECCSCRSKNTPRAEQTIHSLQNRLNRVIGQLNGIKNMLDDNRYCGDILIQIAAAESALQNIGYIILKEHMETCVAEEIEKGNKAVIDEALELIRKLK
ncbi:MAG: metal-sensing transcriptional repressor [Ruminococcus sp.]|nr:metal-sensing transcriptional repressor [Ruminococcus sp.]